MNLTRILFRRLMDAADDNGSAGTDAAAAAAADRGDDFVPADPVDPPADEIVDPPADPIDPPADETPREPDGKFAKKPKDDKDDGKVIPKARFDEQIAKERERAEAAERRAAELEKQAAQVTRNLDIDKAVGDVAELRKQERKALLDGDEKTAAELSAQADRLNRQIAIAESGHMTSEAKEQALEDMRFELTLERMEEKYPTLRPGNEAYDQDLVDDILDKQRGLIWRQRLSPSKALAKAVETVMSRQAKTPAPEGEKAGLAAAQTGEPRKAAAVAKNLDAAARQPGALKDVGLDSDKAGQTKAVPAASAMTLEEYEALPEATRAKMRGDFV